MALLMPDIDRSRCLIHREEDRPNPGVMTRMGIHLPVVDRCEHPYNAGEVDSALTYS